MSGAVWCDFERWSGGSEHPRERRAEILTAQLRSHALIEYIYSKLTYFPEGQQFTNNLFFIVLMKYSNLLR